MKAFGLAASIQVVAILLVSSLALARPSASTPGSAEAYVVAGSIVAFTSNVSTQAREDIFSMAHFLHSLLQIIM